ncbi:MAG: amino acid ABC transporter substrate-binding protein [Mesorhizobium sp.]|nr:MAG: amino acid ABC transporter substrate-binding protein [Mesorhizobium sp.]
MTLSSKRSFLVAASLCAAAAFASSAASAADESLSRIQAAKKVVVCSSNDVPYAYKNPTSGKVEGTDIDMVRAIFEPLGVPEIELYEVPISGIISALNTSRCDLISDNIAITVKRSEQIAFSAPMYRAGQALVVPRGNPAKIKSEADFPGHTVGSYLGTIQLDWLNKMAAADSSVTVKAYKNIPQILAELRAGRLDAAAFDDMVAADALKNDPTLPVEILNYKIPIGDYAVGAGFRKDDIALRQAFDEQNRQLQLSGGLRKVLEKWVLLPVERYFPFPNCCS